MKIKLVIFFLFPVMAFAQTSNLVQYVNTLQGTNSNFDLTHGNTYPTTALPFAMHTWTAQTGRNGDGWKYQYAKNKIRGFQQAHQCSSWSNDYAVFSFMPVADSLVVNEEQRASSFKHENETGKPHYYKVRFDNNITTEMSPVERGAHIRFSYPKGHKSYLVLDGYTGISEIKIFPEQRMITGFVCNGRTLNNRLKSYFVAKFDRPFTAYGTWENKDNTVQIGNAAASGKGTGAVLQFGDGAEVQVKVASSYISPGQATLNLERELGKDKTLEQTKAHAAAVWNEHLSHIQVEGGSKADMETFYSCFFRASLFSRKFYEIGADGKPCYFSPYDCTVHDGYMFTDTGFWDTFRAQFPLNILLYPTMHGRYMQALLAAQKQCGWLPAWSFPAEEGSMIGNHAISLLTDAWIKGVHTFDPQQALEAYYHEVNNKGPWGPANGRDGWEAYNKLGYVPYPDFREATAKTLEYAYDDFCAYTLAKSVHNKKYQQLYAPRMYNYKNVFDPATSFMRGRDAKGNWAAHFDATEWGGPFTEGNAWQWVWSVFHDIKGLGHLLGGDARMAAKMDSVFTIPNTVHVGTYGRMIHEMTEMVNAHMGQYAHGNQPIQHMVYLYNYVGQPWKAQYHAREVMSRLYNATENGYPGDEDQGQTSSWYVLSAMGFYSVCPGTDQYVMGSPLFKKTTITLENGKRFVIDAPGNSDKNVYIKSAILNGQAFSKTWFTYAQIMKGGRLKLQMSDTPDFKRGVGERDRPFSLSDRGAK